MVLEAAASAGSRSSGSCACALAGCMRVQGQAVRELKEGRGLSNSDPEVKAAVEELVRRKEAVERIRGTLDNGAAAIEGQQEP